MRWESSRKQAISRDYSKCSSLSHVYHNIPAEKEWWHIMGRVTNRSPGHRNRAWCILACGRGDPVYFWQLNATLCGFQRVCGFKGFWNTNNSQHLTALCSTYCNRRTRFVPQSPWQARQGGGSSHVTHVLAEGPRNQRHGKHILSADLTRATSDENSRQMSTTMKFAEDCQSGCIGNQGGPLEDDLGVYRDIRWWFQEENNKAG